MASRGIIYEYEDGGKYCGEWENDAAHGHGVCTGPKGNGLFEGLWEKGNQSSGVFTWPSEQKYAGKWRQGVREGAGKETKKDGTEYCGDFRRDSRGPFGVLRQPNGVVYRGTWSEGVQSGEGTEIYIDGGMYRGEYRNGLRHGHGTRSSSNYERSRALKSDHNPNSSVSSSVDESVETFASMLEDPSNNAVSVSITNVDKTNAQVYEGEWKDDKRHGHGVLKIVGHYTYYGQWEDNMRSGYGVMLYDEEKRKEEGQWQRGKLVNVLKRKKLQLKTRQLESKVNQAHMNALQAADTARLKADLAEGRANTASVKARQAVRAAQQAVKDAEVAKANEKLHRNAPKIQENIKSPVAESFSMELSDRLQTGSRWGKVDSAGSANLLHLAAPRLPPTPSYEDITSLVGMSASNPSLQDNGSSGSSESFEEGSGEVESEGRTSRGSLASSGVQGREMDVRRRRAMFHSSRHSSADMVTLRDESASLDLIRDRSNSAMERTHDIAQKRKFLLDIHKASESDPSFTMPPLRNLIDKKGQRLRSRNTTAGSLPESYSESELVLSARERELRKRHINKATGEPNHNEVTDDEDPDKSQPAATTAKPHSPSRPSVSIEVLQQMAHWNKMVAYVNLALLFFLLLLIITVVLCMNYYWLVYHMAPSSGSGSSSLDQSPPVGFMAGGPMA